MKEKDDLVNLQLSYTNLKDGMEKVIVVIRETE